MSILQIQNVSKYYGAEHIFTGIGFNVSRGERLAIVGVNGAGKSTLLRIIANEETPSTGAISPARGIRMAYLTQEARFDEHQTLRGLCDEALQSLYHRNQRARSFHRRFHPSRMECPYGSLRRAVVAL